MSILIEAIRKMGMQTAVKDTARFFGYEPWPTSQFPGRTMLGLRNYPIRTVLDIGALRGELARDVYIPSFPDAVIHSFEPSPQSFHILDATAKGSQGRIVAHNIALGSHSGKAVFHVAMDSVASSSLLPMTKECHIAFPKTERTTEVEVEVRALDEISDALSPALADDLLIKMDVQGFEDRVIRGGKKTFARARACVMEVQRGNFYDGQPTFRDLFLMMDELGFEYIGNLDQAHDAKGNVLYFDAVFLRPQSPL